MIAMITLGKQSWLDQKKHIGLYSVVLIYCQHIGIQYSISHKATLYLVRNYGHNREVAFGEREK